MADEYKFPTALETFSDDYWFAKFVMGPLLLFSAYEFFKPDHPFSAIVAALPLSIGLMMTWLTRAKPEPEELSIEDTSNGNRCHTPRSLAARSLGFVGVGSKPSDTISLLVEFISPFPATENIHFDGTEKSFLLSEVKLDWTESTAIPPSKGSPMRYIGRLRNNTNS